MARAISGVLLLALLCPLTSVVVRWHSCPSSPQREGDDQCALLLLRQKTLMGKRNWRNSDANSL